MEKVQGRRCDELQVKNVLQENVGERDLGLNELSQAKSRGGLSLEKIQGGRYDELLMHKVLYGVIDCDIGCEDVQGGAEC